MNKKKVVYNTCCYDLTDKTTLENVLSLINILTNGADKIGLIHAVWKEVDNFVALKQTQTASGICPNIFAVSDKLSRSLKYLLLLRLSQQLLDMAECFLSGVRKVSCNACLPSRQDLESLLLYLKEVSRHVCDVLNFSEETLLHLLKVTPSKEETKHVLKLCLAESLVCKHYKVLLVDLCCLYTGLKTYCCKLNGDSIDSPENPLPGDIWRWLKPGDSMQKMSVVVKDRLLNLKSISKLADDESECERTLDHVQSVIAAYEVDASPVGNLLLSKFSDCEENDVIILSDEDDQTQLEKQPSIEVHRSGAAISSTLSVQSPVLEGNCTQATKLIESITEAATTNELLALGVKVQDESAWDILNSGLRPQHIASLRVTFYKFEQDVRMTRQKFQNDTSRQCAELSSLFFRVKRKLTSFFKKHAMRQGKRKM